MNCKYCSTEIPEGSVFCPKCGSRMNEQPVVDNAGGTMNNADGNMLDRFNSQSPLKKVLTIGIAVIVLFFVWAVMSPEEENLSTNTANNKVASENTNNSIPANQQQQTAQPAQAKVSTQTAQTAQPAQTTPAKETAKVKNGFYKETYSSGASYEGYFVNNQKQGKGTYVDAKGNKFVGDFSNGKASGQLVIYYANGSRYEGSMVNGNIEGEGTMYYHTGQKYDGHWSANKKSGYGVYKLTNGAVYEGNFVNNQYHDTNGKLTFNNGEVYEGSFVNGTRTGQAIMYRNNGVYEGSFKNNVFSGYGRFEFESGNVYEGYWENGKRNGQGTMYYSNGGSDFGTWQNDVLVSAG